MFNWSKINDHSVTVSPSIVVFTVFLLFSLWFVFAIRVILILLFLAFIIMVALHPAVQKFQKFFHLPRSISAAIVYLIVVTIFVLGLGLLLPPMVQDLYQFLRTFNHGQIPFLQDELTGIKFTVSELSTLAERLSGSFSVVFSIITSTFSGIFTFFTLIVMSVYLMLDRPYLHQKVMWFTKKKEHVALAKDFIDSIEYQLGGWVRGQVVLMIIIGLISYVGLTVIGVPYALPLAVLAGLLEILPNLGPTIAAVPSIILAFFALGPVMAGVTALFYIVMQQFENNLIVPRILRDNVDVNPLVAIVTILIGFELGNVAGALLAIPAYIVVRTIYSYWYKHQVT